MGDPITVRPIGLRAANVFVGEEHRHHPPTRGHKFSVSVHAGAKLVGVAIAGRPVARMLDTGDRLEVLRCCTDGTKNACSALYSACARAGAGMGYRRSDIFTYTLASESGSSLRAAGWVPCWLSDGGEWDRPSRGRTSHAPTEPKIRWHAAPCDWPGFVTNLELIGADHG